MSDRAVRPAVYTIPAHRSFADALAAGLIQRFGRDPLLLANGRILLPNNRAVRAITEAFVRASDGGLILPRLIPIGDPDLEERIGGALDPIDDEAIPPAVDPITRLLALTDIIRGEGVGGAEALRLARDLGRTLDALHIEEVEPHRLADAAADAPDLARHWQLSLERLRAIAEIWPSRLAKLGVIDLADRRNRLLHRLARRWVEHPPEGMTIAAGITSAAPAVAALMHRVARMPGGFVVLPALSLSNALPDEEWDALDAETQTHPQYHLKVLLDGIGVGRGEVEPWPAAGRSASPAVRDRAVANAMTAADFSDKWSKLESIERRLTGIRAAEFADAAAEAQGVALTLRQALETPGRTAALITPDRTLARRVASLLRRWNIEADDSAGEALSETPAGTLLLGIAEVVAEDFAPVPLLALLKHPLVGGEGEERLRWLDHVRLLDLAMRGPRPAVGLAGLDAYLGEEARSAWAPIRDRVAPLACMLDSPRSLAEFAGRITGAANRLAGERAWQGADGRMAAELMAELETAPGAMNMTVNADEAAPILRDLLGQQRVRPPYGGHPRIFIWGLLEARLQHADFVVLGGLNEGVWPARPAPDPWLAPKIRANLGLPSLDYRIGLSAHDFASALGAPQVLITRARRDARSPTVASRFWLRLEAMTGGITRETRLERLVAALDDPGEVRPVDRPRPAPPADLRPRRISVTSVDRLRADPFAFYAQTMLSLRRLDPIDADHSAAWKGTAVHEVLQRWLEEDECDPDKLVPRARALLARETIHPMLRALWQPRLMEAIRWIAGLEEDNHLAGRWPLKAEATGETEIGGVIVYGRVDRIDRMISDGLAVVDYKTGKPPSLKAIEAGYALQLGLLGLIARAAGFEGISGNPRSHEYWSLTKDRDKFGKLVRADEKEGADAFLARADAHFRAAAAVYLTGNREFTAKLHPAYAPYGDYDHLMRLEEWYGRE